MMERLIERGERLAEARQASAVEAVAEEFRDALPGETVEVDGSQVTIVGRGLLKQWLDRADLRFLSRTRR